MSTCDPNDCAYARIFNAFDKFDFIGTIIIIIVLYGIIFPYINNVVLCQFC